MTDSILTDKFSSSRADRAGVIASVLCAIHCAITPFLLILAPAVGGVWSNPLSHWLAAAFVVPLAAFMIRRGYQRHRKRWVLAAGMTGISLILVGAVLPHLSPAEAKLPTASSVHDACCPSIVTDAAGTSRLHIPAAASVTILGGFALILAHIGNLRAGCGRCATHTSKSLGSTRI